MLKGIEEYIQGEYLPLVCKASCNKGNLSNLPTKDLQKGCRDHLLTEETQGTHTNNQQSCLQFVHAGNFNLHKMKFFNK